MEFATWAYPWDVRDEGIGTVSSRLREIGIDELNLATNYHSVQTFSPHNPQQKTHFARASSYFYPDGQYGDLRPTPYEGMNEDWIDLIAAENDDLTLTSWTIGCHNSRLGMMNPKMTLTSPYGDDLIFGLCPSHPSVQQYLWSLVDDLASRESFDRIELETFDYFYAPASAGITRRSMRSWVRSASSCSDSASVNTARRMLRHTILTYNGRDGQS